MNNSAKPKKPAELERERQAESLLAEIFEQAGWRVQRKSHHQRAGVDMLVRRPGVVYAAEVKAGVEGRGDRLVPLFAQAVLQSFHNVGKSAAPLAVVAAPKISRRAAQQVLQFAEQYAPKAAAGVIDFEGLRMFRGAHLEELNAEAPRRSTMGSKSPRISGHLFSDLTSHILLRQSDHGCLTSLSSEGWAHRLHRFHPLSVTQEYQPLRTCDVDFSYYSQRGITSP